MLPVKYPVCIIFFEFCNDDMNKYITLKIRKDYTPVSYIVDFFRLLML